MLARFTLAIVRMAVGATFIRRLGRMAVAMSMTVSVCVQLLVSFINGDRGIGV
jgi:hypothetical protein